MTHLCPDAIQGFPQRLLQLVSRGKTFGWGDVDLGYTVFGLQKLMPRIHLAAYYGAGVTQDALTAQSWGLWPSKGGDYQPPVGISPHYKLSRDVR